MNSVFYLIEPASDMLEAYIKANIETALVTIRTQRNAIINEGVPTPAFKEYFLAPKYSALQPPSLFIICKDIDFKKERGANTVDATAHYTFAAVAEAQTTEQVARATWRYQAALAQLLDNLSLTSADGGFRIKVIVRTADFNQEYDVSTSDGNAAKRWRKEVHLMCDVEFWQTLS